MAVFSECQLTLELDSSLPFKGKLELKRKIIDNGGVISFIVTKKVRRSIDKSGKSALLSMGGDSFQIIVLGEHADHISGSPVFMQV